MGLSDSNECILHLMQKTCINCSVEFEITDEDLAFYKTVSPVFSKKKYEIPPPTHCPECRFQRRTLWRREHGLKNRTCSNCSKSIISIHTSDTPYPVYCLQCWWSDQFDPIEYGKPLDLNRSFLTQFLELYQSVPQITMMNDNGIASENCEYCQDFAFSKNCYLVTGAWKLENCYYCDCNCLESRYLFDCYSVHLSELVYDSIASQRLYRCVYLNHCENCANCLFGRNLIGCKDCIGCVNLRQKQYCILNKQYSAEDYKDKVASLALDTYENYCRFREKFEQLSLKQPNKHIHQRHCEECTGDDLSNCKNVLQSFQQDACEHCKFIIHGVGSQHSYDVSQTGDAHWCYEGATPDNSYMALFTMWCWKDKHVLYSDNCHSSENLFGCIALKRKKYCILNTQYSQEEYESLVGKIIQKMIEDKEWGEFFPMSMSPYYYNETAAQEYFPLQKEQVHSLGLRWRDNNQINHASQTSEIPQKISEVPDDIVNDVLKCISCARSYKILNQELTFYRDMKIPIPRKCNECRYLTRVARRNPRKLWNRECAKCSRKMQTTYSPERPEIVYCEECYLAEVY